MPAPDPPPAAPPPLPDDPLRTTVTPLCSAAGHAWTLACLDDRAAAGVLPPAAAPIPAVVPGSVPRALGTRLPDLNLGANNLNPVFAALEAAVFRYSLALDLPASTAPRQLVFPAVDGAAAISLTYAAGTRPVSVSARADNAFHPHVLAVPPGPPRRAALSVEFAAPRAALRARAAAHAYREWNDPVGGVSRLRVPQYRAGWDWGPRLLLPSLPAAPTVVCAPVARVLDVAQTQRFPEGPGNAPVCVQLVVDVAVSRGPVVVTCKLALAGGDGGDEENGLLVKLHETVAGASPTRAGAEPGSAAARLWHGPLLDGELVARFVGHIDVPEPRLWWPAGMGEQPLYDLTTVVTTTRGDEVDSKSLRIGLRHLELICEPTPHLRMHGPVTELDAGVGDEGGAWESFVFAVNGRRLFAKGANLIPLHVLYDETTRADYDGVARAARAAHMNMLRVWGGGVYEQDALYDACDREGLLVWHDLMFACALYPGDDAFLASCRVEATFQVARLRHRACLALWCGNNELEQVPHDIVATPASKRAYDALFYDVLPAVVRDDAGDTAYWPSSPHNPRGYEAGFNSPRAGDTHFWDVWHARKPVQAYLGHSSRFCSEFGMQSFVSVASARRFAGDAAGALNPYGPVMEAHQKNAAGNLIIQEYCQRLFRLPDGYDALAYQSQLNQLVCMRVGVEHFRRSWPFCAGALYWQLNDCWPCASWSSLEYGGKWKALHHGARRFFAPLLLSLVHRGAESVGVCNLTRFDEKTGLFAVHAVFDGLEHSLPVRLSWSVIDVRTGEARATGEQTLELARDSSVRLKGIDARDASAGDPRSVVVHARLCSADGRYRSVATGWLCAPRLCELPAATVSLAVARFERDEENGCCSASVELVADAFAPFTELYFRDDDRPAADGDGSSETRTYEPATVVSFSDNFFDLFADECTTVEVSVPLPLTLEELEDRLSCRSLVDSYMK